ncbi:unnamed protein product [Allacma fusca]|uniref:Uncharacterized protein n=1 Tax=Allacma fusca TaxID=39272 RepID=A0A8J2K4B4_9HEXA|nr:unnamed protein product [Allacma fusca]
MARLQKSLRGAALATVQGRMISPENLEQVLMTLEMRFGRPDIVVRTLIEKTRKTPITKDDKLEMLITFPNLVQNLVSTMRVLKGSSYMLNPELPEEFAAKMPSKIEDDSDVKSNTFHRKDGKKRNSDIELKATDDNKKTETLPKPKICSICDKPNHTPEKCAMLIKLTSDERWKTITNKRLCFHCLQRGCQLSKHST